MNIGKIKTDVAIQSIETTISIDESVCGMIFDTHSRSGLFFGHTLARKNLENESVLEINNLAEAEALGITSDFMDGIPHYHLSKYYGYLGTEQKLYVMFADVAGMDVTDSPIERMLMESGNSIFQIGVWTESPIFGELNGSYYGLTQLLPNINDVLGIIEGSESAMSGYPSNINVLVFGGTKKSMKASLIPSVTLLDYKKLSVVFGQERSDAVHAMQAKTLNESEIGLMGNVLGLLTKMGAEECIANVGKCNMNAGDMLGSVELGFDTDYIPLSDMLVTNEGYVDQEFADVTLLADKGFIIPVTYEAKQGGVYLCGDGTLSDGDYKYIFRNRLIHKFKRVMKNVLLKKINAPIMLANTKDHIKSSEATTLTGELIDAIDTYMKNKQEQDQLSAFNIVVDEHQPNIMNDELDMECALATLDHNDVLDFIEEYKGSNIKE